ncbi:MAG: hypothetical protein IKK92_06265 [Prevotella sp.]|nr:hypothetical protein [Prevotella sp.]MBQ2949615.1 hypothetical protein [Prevotella sp.]MBR6592615.1 hypothetical protein [Prevotella sp.]MBR6605456.1 hypothetical protein [Prevotella sp.]
MASKKTLKHNIEIICSELLAECIAISLYDSEVKKDNVEALLHSIIKIESNYIARISHPEPGMKPKLYYKDLIDNFSRDVNEIVDHINNLH